MVDYDLENLERPILSVEEAVKRSSLFEVPPFLFPKQVGDISKGMAEADQKILSAEVLLIYNLCYPPQAPSSHTLRVWIFFFYIYIYKNFIPFK